MKKPSAPTSWRAQRRAHGQLGIAVLLTAHLLACAGGSSTDAKPPTLVSIAFPATALVLPVSGTQQLDVTGTYSDGSTSVVSAGLVFVSAAPTVAVVSSTGLVTAESPGTAVVTASVGALNATVTVQCTTPALAYFSLTPNPLALSVGSAGQLVLSGSTAGGGTTDLTASATWAIANAAVASVSASGLVTALAGGSTTVTGTVMVGAVTKTATATVMVAALPLASVAVTPNPLPLSVGGSGQLTLTGTDVAGGTADLTASATWAPADASVVSISASGLVTALAVGSTTVTGTVTVGTVTKSASSTVTVAASALASVAVTPNPLSLTVGGAGQLTLAGTDVAGGTTNLTASATWAPTDSSVVSVSASGLVTALAIGSTTVTGTVTVGTVTKSATAAVSVAAAQGPYDPGAGWTLVWSDEFDGTAVDSANWNFDIGAGGWGNGEWEYYRAENATVDGGFLTITAKAEAFADAGYTSARMQTSQKQAFTYGKVSMRAKLPFGQGIWPAFWMLGADSSSFNLYGGTVPWPACGEADIMEMIGGLADGSGDYTTHGTLHYLNAAGRDPGPSFAYRNPAKLSDDFHIYELVWTPHSFTWLLDGLAYGTKIVDPDMGAFSKPMFILLNLAIGGPWGGWPDSTTVFPQTYVVDWVRVYENASTVPGGSPGLATTWHLSNAPSTGVTPVVETLSPNPGTTSGFQPTKALTAPATWVGPPLTGHYEAGAWSVRLFTGATSSSAVVKVEVFKTAADGSAPVSLGSAQVDVNTTGGGNHASWFTLVGVPTVTFAGERMELVVTPVSGATVTLVYNGNDFDSLVETPWSPAGP